MSAVLDTHVLLWWVNTPESLSPAMSRCLTTAAPGAPLVVPDIVLWEVAMLVSLGRIRLGRPVADWLRKATAPPLVTVVPISPEVAAEVAALPDWFQRDPGDRIVVATARVLGLPLLTVDQKILSSGLVATIS